MIMLEKLQSAARSNSPDMVTDEAYKLMVREKFNYLSELASAVS
jgi:hypothetical protein